VGCHRFLVLETMRAYIATKVLFISYNSKGFSGLSATILCSNRYEKKSCSKKEGPSWTITILQCSRLSCLRVLRPGQNLGF
jgi:hypothetical protein